MPSTPSIAIETLDRLAKRLATLGLPPLTANPRDFVTLPIDGDRPDNRNVVLAHRSAVIEDCKFEFTGSNNILVIDDKAVLRSLLLRFKRKGGIALLERKARVRGGTIQLDGRDATFRIGASTSWEASNTNIIEPAMSVIVGARCMISRGVQIETSDSHPIFDLETGERINHGGNVVIGDGVWLDRGVRVGKGVTIGDGAIVGQASLVTKHAEAGCLHAGVPARLLRQGVAWRPSLKDAFVPAGAA